MDLGRQEGPETSDYGKIASASHELVGIGLANGAEMENRAPLLMLELLPPPPETLYQFKVCWAEQGQARNAAAKEKIKDPSSSVFLRFIVFECSQCSVAGPPYAVMVVGLLILIGEAVPTLVLMVMFPA